MDKIPFLTLITMLPAVAGLLLCMVPDKKGELTKWVSLIVSLVVAGLSIIVYAAFNEESSAMQFVENHAWIPAFQARYHLSVDGISLAMVALTGI